MVATAAVVVADVALVAAGVSVGVAGVGGVCVWLGAQTIKLTRSREIVHTTPLLVLRSFAAKFEEQQRTRPDFRATSLRGRDSARGTTLLRVLRSFRTQLGE